jgi:hypothetical protein
VRSAWAAAVNQAFVVLQGLKPVPDIGGVILANLAVTSRITSRSRWLHLNSIIARQRRSYAKPQLPENLRQNTPRLPLIWRTLNRRRQLSALCMFWSLTTSL